jgi:ABC-2 type transport system permease protein
MEKKKTYARIWWKDFFGIFMNELHLIFSDWGVMIIFFLAGLLYPLLYNLMYLNGVMSDTPIAVVDNADCMESRRYAREVDATRECAVAYHCLNMPEAEKLMQEGKVHGIFYFPSDFGEKINRLETATVSIYTDMSSFLYYKNALIAANMVMLHEVNQIQVERYTEMGFSGQEASQIVQAVPYEENNPYNRAFSYSIFLISAILFVIVQQTMFYGMSMLVGTAREQNRSFASLPDQLEGLGVGRVVLGRGFAYWLIYLAISLYIAMIVPAIFGIPQRGQYWEILLLVLVFVTDCVMFCSAWSSVITRRESVFLLFLFISPICLFLTGCSWPTFAFPKFWKVFSYLFPTTFGCQAFINMSTAGGDIMSAHVQLIAMTLQTIIYYAISCIAIFIENWIIKHKEMLLEARDKIAAKAGIDLDEDRRIIAGKSD